MRCSASTGKRSRADASASLAPRDTQDHGTDEHRDGPSVPDVGECATSHERGSPSTARHCCASRIRIAELASPRRTLRIGSTDRHVMSRRRGRRQALEPQLGARVLAAFRDGNQRAWSRAIRALLTARFGQRRARARTPRWNVSTSGAPVIIRQGHGRGAPRLLRAKAPFAARSSSTIASSASRCAASHASARSANPSGEDGAPSRAP